MVGKISESENSESGSARVVFAARLQALFEAAGNPTLARVRRAAAERRSSVQAKNHTAVEIPAQRISEWRRGDRLPKTFDSVEFVILALRDLALATSDSVPSELTHMPTWQKLWEHAHADKDTPRPTRGRDENQARPVLTSTLHRDITHFVGRDAELQRILASTKRGRVVSIHAINGMPGIGKTALAIRAAHRLGKEFPHGRFVAELHAHTLGQPPATPFDVLARLLADLGIDPRYVPPSLEGRRDLWLDRVNGKRILLILDDAADIAQVEPLLPAGEGCLTLITSRRRLDLDGAVPLPLDVLDPDSAAQLFIDLAHRDSADDRAAVEEIVALCGYLPLAIVILAGRLAHRPAWTISGLAAEFTAATDRLAELGTEQRAVRAAFELSYRDLPPERARFFRNLGLHPGLDTDAHAAAALTGIAVDTARAELDALYTDNLIDETTPGRFRLHDLLRSYARTLADNDTDSNGNERALDQLLDYYQASAASADRLLGPRTRPVADCLAAVSPRVEVQEFSDQACALTWMRAERANLLACLDHVTDRQPSRLVELSGSLAGLLERDGPWPLAVDIYHRAALAAGSLADRLGQANALISLGYMRRFNGDRFEATDAHQQALALYEELGNRLGEANALHHLGVMRRDRGEFGPGTDLLQQSLIIYREIGNRLGEASVLHTIGATQVVSGELGAATDTLQQSLVICREIGSRTGEANTLAALGVLRQKTGEYGAATDVLQQSLIIYHEVGNPVGEANALTRLGGVYRLIGELESATDVLQQSLIIYRELGSHNGEADGLFNLGIVHQLCGEYESATDALQQSLIMYRKLGSRDGEGNALIGLGVVRHLCGDYELATDLLQQSLNVCRELGNRLGEADALNYLGVMRQQCGEYELATDLLQQSLIIYHEVGSLAGEADALNGVALVLLSSGEPTEALAVFTEALAMARTVGSQENQARALDGTGRCHAALGDIPAAVSDLRAAVEIYRHMGSPEADTTAAYLAELESRSLQD
ncbi:tetratricopeptide repeat protein [Nocardia sp. NBC_01327]|uniref:tetratricopeptide repeat protein n=1 Tax=Nocardia sp. NBC_01327 TaxID=2903593 RepID=UPI002E12B463|nr:tetratricopeptide repeat protein [Nocardia sp. NBC_01327]